MQVLALVPARGGSKGVPGKNIKGLGGRPLIAYTIASATAVRGVSRVVVSTDSDDIAEVSRREGAEVPFLRPADIAADETPMKAVVAHALEWLAEHDGWVPDAVVLLQPTVPFRDATLIDRAIDMLRDGADAVVSVTPVPTAYHADWQFEVRDGILRRMTGGHLAGLVTRRQELRPAFVRDGAIYAFRHAMFATTGSFYSDRTLALVNLRTTVNIDTADDWLLAESMAQTWTPDR